MRRAACLVLLSALVLPAWDLNQDLLDAARSGDLALVQSLLDKGADIESRTSYGQTPLFLAAMYGRADVVRLLLDKGADANARDTFYKTPAVQTAIERKHFEVAALLIARKAGLPDDNLVSAVNTGRPELVLAVLTVGGCSQPVLDRMRELAATSNQEGTASLLAAAGAHAPPAPVHVEPRILESYAGVYKSDRYLAAFRVLVQDGTLFAQNGGYPEAALTSRSDTLFVDLSTGEQFRFSPPNAFTWIRGDNSIQFGKVGEP